MLQKFIVPGTDATGSSWAGPILDIICVHQGGGPDGSQSHSSSRPEQNQEARHALRRPADLRALSVDTTRRKRFTTVELIVDESDWTASIPIAAEAPPPVPTESPTETAIETPAGATKEPYGEPAVAKPDLVGLRVGFNEVDLRQNVKAVGAK